MSLISKKNDSTALEKIDENHRVTVERQESATDLRNTLPTAPKRSSVLDGLRRDYEKAAFPSRNMRIAHLLMWCAKNYPGQYITWKDIYKIIRDGEAAKERALEEFRRSGSHINRLLLERWSACLVCDNGGGTDHGVRASVNDNDTALAMVEKTAKAVVGAHRRWARVTQAINPNKVNDARLRKFLTSKSIAALTKAAVNPDYLQKLLPPAPETRGSKKPSGSNDDK